MRLSKIDGVSPETKERQDKKVLGGMHAHGFRLAYAPGGEAGCYQPVEGKKKDIVAYRAFIGSLDRFADTLQRVMDRYCPVKVLQAAHVQLQANTPTMTKSCFMGNLTVAFNYASSVHKDRDASWALDRH
jgi:hypothetical protein